MKDIIVKYRYSDHTYNGYGERIDGHFDTVIVDIAGQIFKESHLTVGEMIKKNNRERYEAFGRLLERIGKGIQRQAKYGKPSEMILPTGQKIKNF